MLAVVRLTHVTSRRMVSIIADSIVAIVPNDDCSAVYVVGRSEPFLVRESDTEVLAMMNRVLVDDDDEDDDDDDDDIIGGGHEFDGVEFMDPHEDVE